MERSLIAQVRKFADLNTNAILDPDCHLFKIPEIDGLIGYRIKENCAVVFGDPLCSPSDKIKLATAFKEHCETQKFNVIYTMISENFASSAINLCGRICLEVGHKIILDPTSNPMNKTGDRASLVRRKVRHALKSDVTILEYTSEDENLEK
jgi:lysylphosphatidylglycerol synthetase-like protein (DUF2156 family)